MPCFGTVFPVGVRAIKWLKHTIKIVFFFVKFYNSLQILQCWEVQEFISIAHFNYFVKLFACLSSKICWHLKIIQEGVWWNTIGKCFQRHEQLSFQTWWHFAKLSECVSVEGNVYCHDILHQFFESRVRDAKHEIKLIPKKQIWSKIVT